MSLEQASTNRVINKLIGNEQLPFSLHYRERCSVLGNYTSFLRFPTTHESWPNLNHYILFVAMDTLHKTLAMIWGEARKQNKLSYHCCIQNQFLSELLLPYTPTQVLRSSGSSLLTIPRFRLSSMSGNLFSVAVPKLGNSLLKREPQRDLLHFLL